MFPAAPFSGKVCLAPGRPGLARSGSNHSGRRQQTRASEETSITTPTDKSIQIAVTTQYVDAQSEPAKERFVFAYTITITNHTASASQLLNRHWIVTDASGNTEEVRGEGVVGQQPRLTPGESFQYTSGAILKTPVGCMEGSYEFRDDAGALFRVPIPPFSLSMPNVVH